MIVKKLLRYSFYCGCGFTSIDDTNETNNMTARELFAAGFRRRKFRDGSIVYELKDQNTTCNGGHHE